MRAAGSLPGLRIGTNGSPSRAATGAPKRKPRDSMPTMTSAAPTAPPCVEREAEGRRVAQQRRDVAEEDALLREVRHVADVPLEVHLTHGPQLRHQSSTMSSLASRL